MEQQIRNEVGKIEGGVILEPALKCFLADPPQNGVGRIVGYFGDDKNSGIVIARINYLAGKRIIYVQKGTWA